MDFKKFYEEQPEYFNFRNNPEEHYEYQVAIAWKSSNILQCIEDTPKVEKLLEIGCAFGELLDILGRALHASVVCGVDIASANITMAKNSFPAYHFFEGPLESLDLLKIVGIDKFDVVILSDIVEHIPDDVAFLKRIASITKNVIMNLPLEKSFVTRHRQYGESDSSGHLRCYDLDKAIELINVSGYEIVFSKVETFYAHPPHRKLFLEKERVRLRSKPFVKMVILRALLESIFFFGYFFPIVFKKYYGSNLFCLLKPQDGE